MNDSTKPGFNVNAAWDKLSPPRSDRLEESRGKQQQGYEQKIIGKILAAAGNTMSPRHMRENAMANFQTDTLNMSWFQQAYPTFPVHLRIEKIDWAYKAMSDLFLSFGKSVIYKALRTYIVATGLNEATNFFGVVFTAPKLGDMVLHTYPHQPISPKEQHKLRDRSVFIYTDDEFDYTLETLPRLLEKIGDSWIN